MVEAPPRLRIETWTRFNWAANMEEKLALNCKSVALTRGVELFGVLFDVRASREGRKEGKEDGDEGKNKLYSIDFKREARRIQ